MSLITTLVDDYFLLNYSKNGLKILLDKYQLVNERYGTDNLVVPSKVLMELAQHFFEIGKLADGEELLSSVSTFAARYIDAENYHDAHLLYKAVNKLATEHLPAENRIVLDAKFGLIRTNHYIGNALQAIELCEQNLPTFRKVFGKHDDKTLLLMKILGENYLALGKYAQAKQIVDARLKVCKQDLGKRDKRTVDAAIDLAKIYYRTGKYKSGDKILVAVGTDAAEMFKTNIKVKYDLLYTISLGTRMQGGNIVEQADFLKTSYDLMERGFLDLSDTLDFELETLKHQSALGSAGTDAQSELALMNVAKLRACGHHPKILAITADIADIKIAYGYTRDAARLADEIIYMSRSGLGGNNICEWMGLITLGKVRRAEGNADAALKFDEQALQIAEGVCGVKSLERLQSLDAIASDNAALGNVVEAVRIRRQALRDARNFLEDSDAVTCRTLRRADTPTPSSCATKRLPNSKCPFISAIKFLRLPQ